MSHHSIFRSAVVLLLFVIVLGYVGSLYATEVAFTGQIRYRFEWDDRDFNSDTDSINGSFLRSRLTLKAETGKLGYAVFQFQDSRVFGEENSTLTDGSADNFDLHQGYFVIPELFGLPLEFKVGRMTLAYGNERLLGAVEWHNIARRFDGLWFSFKQAEYTIDFFNMKQIEEGKEADEGDLNVYGIYSELKMLSPFNLQLYWIQQQLHPASNLNRYTAGFYLSGTHGGLSEKIECAYQGGKREDLDVSAYMLTFWGNYQFRDSAMTPSIGLGVDYLSGDDDASDDRYHTFDTLYATNHKFYGFMDYFVNIPANTNGAGLVDTYLRVGAATTEAMKLYLTVHSFTAAQSVEIEGNSYDDYGVEYDITAKYNYSKVLKLELGISFFTPGDIAEKTVGEDTSSWYYFMATYSF